MFGAIDFVVQAGALLSQLFITGRIAQRLGVRVLLAAVPALVCLGFVGLALAPTFAVLAAVMIVRRIGEYAFVRPGREMLSHRWMRRASTRRRTSSTPWSIAAAMR